MKKDKAAKHLGLASISSEPATLAKEFEKEEVKAAKVEMEELEEKREEKAEAKAEATEKAAAKPKTQKAQKMWRGQTMESVDEKMTMKMNAIRAQMKKDKAAKHLGLASISSEPATLAKEF